MRGRSSLLQSVALTALLALPALGATVARAAEAEAPVAVSPVDDFNRQLEEVKKSFGALGGKIEQSTRDIEKLTKPDDARKEIAALQGMIAEALGAVSDNGDVAKLGQKALDFARSKQKQFEADAKFSAEERQYLLNEWRRIGGEIERANGDLGNARQEFSQLLRNVQTRGDYIEELKALNNAQKMLEVIRLLAGDIRNASDAMKSFIAKVTPPSPGT
jgi:phage shock protein A